MPFTNELLQGLLGKIKNIKVKAEHEILMFGDYNSEKARGKIAVVDEILAWYDLYLFDLSHSREEGHSSYDDPGDTIPAGHWDRLKAHLSARASPPPEADIDDPDP